MGYVGILEPEKIDFRVQLADLSAKKEALIDASVRNTTTIQSTCDNATFRSLWWLGTLITRQEIQDRVLRVLCLLLGFLTNFSFGAIT